MMEKFKTKGALENNGEFLINNKKEVVHTLQQYAKLQTIQKLNRDKHRRQLKQGSPGISISSRIDLKFTLANGTEFNFNKVTSYL